LQKWLPKKQQQQVPQERLEVLKEKPFFTLIPPEKIITEIIAKIKASPKGGFLFF